jgi:hypothetical protein
VLYFGAVDFDGRMVVEEHGCVHVRVPVLGFVRRHAHGWFGRAEAVEPGAFSQLMFQADLRPIDRAVPQMTYLCTSPAAGPSDRHRIQMSAKNPTANKNRGFRAACVKCREGGRRALAAFHEYSLLSSMSSGEDVPSGVVSSPSLACDMRTDMLRSRRMPVSLRSRFRCTCKVEGFEGGESSFAVGAPGRKTFLRSRKVRARGAEEAAIRRCERRKANGSRGERAIREETLPVARMVNVRLCAGEDAANI